MTYSIAFCGVDGSGKTTLINKVYKLFLKEGWIWKIHHQNKIMKKLYWHQHSRIWEWLNYIELRYRNWRWQYSNNNLILDRCYICGLVYSNMEGFPDIAHKIKKYALKPDIIVLMEPVEELVPHAYDFTREYKRMLTEEGYEQFKIGFHLFGRTTFWRLPEIELTPLLATAIGIIGSP